MTGAGSELSGATTIHEGRVKEAVRLAGIVPQPYREKASEMIFGTVCPAGTGTGGGGDNTCYRMPAAVRAFLAKFVVPEVRINGYYMITGPGGVFPMCRVGQKVIARAQIQIACIQAPGQALLDGGFEFSIGEVRDARRGIGCFGSGDLMANFGNRADLFKSLTTGIMRGCRGRARNIRPICWMMPRPSPSIPSECSGPPFAPQRLPPRTPPWEAPQGEAQIDPGDQMGSAPCLM
ncbi:hypothetical protein IBTHAUMO2_990025 [Nitrosopumilaceae archaeon]|nr:hypothetical protein IBTHAUMO2_990025 [Nitrosopumilaceae archaeon]